MSDRWARLDLDRPWNPYLAEAERYVGVDSPDALLDVARGGRAASAARRRLTTRYGWAVPDEGALAEVARHSPIVEVGAGSGYWARLLRDRGAVVHAYDLYPPVEVGPPCVRSRYKRGAPWTEVLPGGPKAIRAHPGASLLLVWPPLRSPMARRCLSVHQEVGGEVVLYVGEWFGCTADDAFHERAEAEYEVVREVAIPVWAAVHDRLTVLRRRRGEHFRENAPGQSQTPGEAGGG